MVELRVNTNANGRYYPPDVLRKAVEDMQERVKAGRVFGQIDPPGDGRTKMGSASHVIESVRVDGTGAVIGKVRFLDTPEGKLAFDMVKRKIPIGGTLRGTGTVSPDGVVSNYKLDSVDVTLSPGEEPDAVTQLGDIVRDPGSES